MLLRSPTAEEIARERGLTPRKGWSTLAHADSRLSAYQGGTTSQAVLQKRGVTPYAA